VSVVDREEPVASCWEWHADGTAGEDGRGSGLAAMAPAQAMGEARPRRHEPRWQAPRWARGSLAPTPKAADEEPPDQDDDGQDDQELKDEAHAGCVDVHQRCH
jgi:hypothetical protein